MFADRGLDAPLDDVARAAGVSIGTLYNRFPTRADLIDAAVCPVVEESVASAEAALAADDPWDALVAHPLPGEPLSPEAVRDAMEYGRG